MPWTCRWTTSSPKNKPSHSRGRGRRNPTSSSGGPVPARRRAANRSAAAPYRQLNFQPQQVPPAFGYVAQPRAMVTAPSSGFDITPTTKLYISNLDYNASNEDIKDLFSEMGEIKRYSINYDKSGRSKGTAEVVFSTKAEYNNVQLDGKPMKIEVIGINTEAPAPASAIFTFARPPLPGNFSFPPKRVPILRYILHDGDIWGLWRRHERHHCRGCRCKLKLGNGRKLMLRVW